MSIEREWGFGSAFGHSHGKLAGRLSLNAQILTVYMRERRLSLHNQTSLSRLDGVCVSALIASPIYQTQHRMSFNSLGLAKLAAMLSKSLLPPIQNKPPAKSAFKVISRDCLDYQRLSSPGIPVGSWLLIAWTTPHRYSTPPATGSLKVGHPLPQ